MKKMLLPVTCYLLPVAVLIFIAVTAAVVVPPGKTLIFDKSSTGNVFLSFIAQ